jgi:hypothetical protein
MEAPIETAGRAAAAAGSVALLVSVFHRFQTNNISPTTWISPERPSSGTNGPPTMVYSACEGARSRVPAMRHSQAPMRIGQREAEGEHGEYQAGDHVA